MRGEERRNKGTRRGWMRDGRQRDEGWKVKGWRQKGRGRRGEGVRDEGVIVSDEEGGRWGWLGRGGRGIWEKPEPSEAGIERADGMTNQTLLTIPGNVSHCIRRLVEPAANRAVCEGVSASLLCKPPPCFPGQSLVSATRDY